MARPARAPGREPRHRPPGDQPGRDARLREAHRQHHSRELRVLLAAARLRLRSGQGEAAPRRGRLSRTGSTPATTPATPSYDDIAEPVVNYLHAVGIRVKLRPLERAAFFKGQDQEKKFKNLVQGGERRRSATRRRASRRSSPPAAPTSTAAIRTSTGSSASRRPSSTASGARRRCTGSSSSSTRRRCSRRSGSSRS